MPMIPRSDLWSSRVPTVDEAPPSPAGLGRLPDVDNEPYLMYRDGTPERARLDDALASLAGSCADIPLVIGGQEVRTGRTAKALVPHDRSQVLAEVHQASSAEVTQAIEAAATAFSDWSRWPWQERLSIFFRAAQLIAGPYREKLVAATMLDQSKTVYEAEADAVCELADFFRFNAVATQALMEIQPRSTVESWNRMDYRPLEGFVYAVTPFNFAAIGGNLPTAPAMLGNVAVWKPSAHAMYSAHLIMEILKRAGLPDGVINLVYGDAEVVTDVALSHPYFAGLHFTGSTAAFHSMWQRVGSNLDRYAGFPRIVGETGGKDFVLAHGSADPSAVAAAVVRGAFEYQGQKCSAASRLYVPRSLWGEVREQVAAAVERIQMGDVADSSTYMGAVIHEDAFGRHRQAIESARSEGTDIIVGGGTDDADGWFVEPTLIETSDPSMRLLHEELFGPIVTAFVYDDDAWDATLRLVDKTGKYALTGSIFAESRAALTQASAALTFAAGNLYLNDKPTGAIVGQQPFGGGRGSGTNDKTGTLLHMARWSGVRTVKDSFVAPTEIPIGGLPED